MDDGDYPSDELLQRIREWPSGDLAGALDYVKAEWHWPDMARHELSDEETAVALAEPGDRFLRLATGGWSGNESIVAAMEANRLLGLFCWVLSARGGLSIWKYPA